MTRRLTDPLAGLRSSLLACTAAILSLLAGEPAAAHSDGLPPAARVRAIAQDDGITNPRCPVLTDEDVDPEIFSEYRGKRVFLCCRKCLKKFQASPEAYVRNLPAGFFSEQADRSAADHKNHQDEGPAPSEQAVLTQEEIVQEHDHSQHGSKADSGLPLWIAWIGRFHPMVVHFPIALLMAAALAEALTLLTATARFAFVARFLPAVQRADPPRTVSSEALAKGLPPGIPGRDYAPTTTPNSITLPHRLVNGAKVFHLIAEDVEHEFAPGMKAHCWGYNGRVHGPTIEAVEGDRVRIYVTNRLDVPTSVHWHGLLIPNGMDGVGGLTQRPIPPRVTFKYEYVLRQHGTYMYHSHHDEMTQMAMGMMGLFVIHPRSPGTPPPDRDYSFLLSEWKLTPGLRRPDPNEMADFNVLTFNAKIAPATDPIVARTGERVRIRIGNLSAMDHHPIHLHGHSFVVTETDGGLIPEQGRWPEVSVLVPVGSTRTIEFVADNPGDWALHCHMTHHVMTQMGHGIPNLIGVDPSLFDHKLEEIVPEFESMGMATDGEPDDSIPPNSLPMVSTRGPFGYITMSGMFTLLKVRDRLDESAQAGAYEHPAGTVADAASKEELLADGIET